MSQFYFLLASLPTITPESPLPMRADAFLEYASKWMTESELEILKATSLVGADAAQGDSFQSVWNAFVFDVRNELARTRSAKLGFEAARWMHKDEEGLSPQLNGADAEAVRSAVHTADPVEGERVLAQLFWTQLDKQTFGYPFGFQAVQAYFLKVQILERFAAFTVAAGEARFAQQYEMVSQRIAEADQNPDRIMENG